MVAVLLDGPSREAMIGLNQARAVQLLTSVAQWGTRAVAVGIRSPEVKSYSAPVQLLFHPGTNLLKFV